MTLRADCQSTASGGVKLVLFMNGAKVAEVQDTASNVFRRGVIGIGSEVPPGSGPLPVVIYWGNVTVTGIGPVR